MTKFFDLVYNPQIGAFINFDIRSILKQKELRKNYNKRRGFFPYNFNFVLGFRGDLAQCSYCGKFLSMRDMTRDHVWPKSLGGITTTTSCYPCNTMKKNMKPIEFAIWYSSLYHKNYASLVSSG